MKRRIPKYRYGSILPKFDDGGDHGGWTPEKVNVPVDYRTSIDNPHSNNILSNVDKADTSGLNTGSSAGLSGGLGAASKVANLLPSNLAGSDLEKQTDGTLPTQINTGTEVANGAINTGKDILADAAAGAAVGGAPGAIAGAVVGLGQGIGEAFANHGKLNAEAKANMGVNVGNMYKKNPASNAYGKFKFGGLAKYQNGGEVENKPLYNVDPSKYETKLDSAKEVEFQKWLEDYHNQGKISSGDYSFYKDKNYGYDYDFRAAFQNGVKPEINKEDNKWHWNDLGKKPNEPTFSNQSKYNGIDGMKGGSWNGNKFIPPVLTTPVQEVSRFGKSVPNVELKFGGGIGDYGGSIDKLKFGGDAGEDITYEKDMLTRMGATLPNTNTWESFNTSMKPVNIKDNRQIDAITNNKIDSNKRLNSSVNPMLAQRIADKAKEKGLDPYTALAIAYQETGISNIDQINKREENNPFHIFDPGNSGKMKDPESALNYSLDFLKKKLDSGKNKGYSDEASILQSYNGYGTIKKGHDDLEGATKIYGVDIPDSGLNLKNNPLYGKRILDVRENIIKKNPYFQKLIDKKQEDNTSTSAPTNPKLGSSMTGNYFKLGGELNNKPYYKNGGVLEGEFDVDNISEEELNHLKKLGYSVNILK